MELAQVVGSAAFSRCGRYRWWLGRRWRDDAPTLLFLGLNPSGADGKRDDPTLRRLIGFADGWGYGAIEVLNLFAWISTDPAGLRLAAEPVGHRNDAWIRRRVQRLLQQETASRGQPPDRRGAPGGASLPLWLGWGNGGSWQGRDQEVLRLLAALPLQLHWLGPTAAGQPRHPLYVAGGRPLLPCAPSLGQSIATTAAPCRARHAATRSI